MGQVQIGKVFQSHYDSHNTVIYYEWPKEEETNKKSEEVKAHKESKESLKPLSASPHSKGERFREAGIVLNLSETPNPGIDDLCRAAETKITFRKYEQALKLLERIMRMPESSNSSKYLKDILIMYSRAYLGIGDKEKAKQSLQSALNSFPDDSALNFYMSEFYAEQENNLNAAIKYAKKACVKKDKFNILSVSSRMNLINLYTKKGEVEKAEIVAQVLKSDIIAYQSPGTQNIKQVSATLNFLTQAFKDKLTPEITAILSGEADS